MNTISVISSVSFNTPQFFEMKIRELTDEKSRILDWCHWIVHKPDTDQTKPHIHFVCKPSYRIDTNALRNAFKEPVTVEYLAQIMEHRLLTKDDEKPLGCLPFVKTTSMSDWLLYGIHDEGYLFKKGQSRNTHYQREDVKSTDPDFLSVQWEETIDPLQALTQRVIYLATVEHMGLGDILQTGIVPPNLVFYFKTLLDSRSNEVVRRARWVEDANEDEAK